MYLEVCTQKYVPRYLPVATIPIVGRYFSLGEYFHTATCDVNKINLTRHDTRVTVLSIVWIQLWYQISGLVTNSRYLVSNLWCQYPNKYRKLSTIWYGFVLYLPDRPDPMQMQGRAVNISQTAAPRFHQKDPREKDSRAGMTRPCDHISHALWLWQVGPELVVKNLANPTTCTARCTVSHTNSTTKTKKSMTAAINPTSLAVTMAPLYGAAIDIVTQLQLC